MTLKPTSSINQRPACFLSASEGGLPLQLNQGGSSDIAHQPHSRFHELQNVTSMQQEYSYYTASWFSQRMNMRKDQKQSYIYIYPPTPRQQGERAQRRQLRPILCWSLSCWAYKLTPSLFSVGPGRDVWPRSPPNGGRKLVHVNPRHHAVSPFLRVCFWRPFLPLCWSW